MPPMESMTALVCIKCGDRYSADQPVGKCECGGLLDLEFSARFDRRTIAARPPSLWRYREALPLDDDRNVVSFGEGFTPLTPFKLGGREILIKQDQVFPSGSYKDRGGGGALLRQPLLEPVLLSWHEDLGI